MLEKLENINERFQKIEQEMTKPEVISNQNLFRDLNKEHSHLTPIIKKYEEYSQAVHGIKDSKELLEEESDNEMKEMLQSEIDELEATIPILEKDLTILLLPKDPNSGKDVIIEIRAGTGGDEAALFAADLFNMYERYTQIKGWKFEYIEGNYTEINGFKEVAFSIRSDEAYDSLKFESGVHRVQRIPSTESGGRIHTSAVTVAVMPEAEESDLEIAENDVRVDVFRASGNGGQSVNTTDSAVRLTHIPTGMIVSCQDEKSQHKNKAKAMRVLRARLNEKIMRERQEEESELRKSMVGSGDRSERIRTYNFPQSRITDHRIGLTLYNLEAFLAGDCEDVINALKKHEIAEMLKNLNK